MAGAATEPTRGRVGKAVDALVMDHVAVVSERAWDNVIRYGRDIGGRWIGGPDNDPTSEAGDDFYFCQMRFEGDARIEILEPIPGAGSDFLRRFLARNGAGPHHFTFKTPDFDATVAALEEAGYEVIGVNAEHPTWKEAFVHPKDGWGIVIQIAWSGGQSWVDAPPLPLTHHERPTRLASATLLVADAEAAAALFTGPLEMTRVGELADAKLGSGVVLRSGPWTLNLLTPADATLAHWMGNRTGRLHSLGFELDDPALVPRAQRLNSELAAQLAPLVGGDGPGGSGDVFLVQPEDNQGVRLLLREHSR